MGRATDKGASSATATAPIDRDLLIHLEGAAKPVPFRVAVSKGEKTYWGILGLNDDGKRVWDKRGVKLNVSLFEVADPTVLPTKATITDPVTGESVDVTFDSTDDKGEALRRENGQPFVQVKRQTISLPGVCADRVIKGTLSLAKDGNWVTTLVANNQGGGAGPKPLGPDDL